MSDFEPKIIAFCCQYCSYSAADLAGSMRLQYPTNVEVVLLPCTGRMDIIHVLKAFESGADGVYAAGCLEGNCHFITGNLRARKRMNYIKTTLEQMGVEPERVEMFNLSAAQGTVFVENAKNFTERIKGLGPSPFKHNTAAA